jgi:hypothetical protein
LPQNLESLEKKYESISKGFPYPTADEVKVLGQHMERRFEAMSGSRGEGHSVMEHGAEYGEGGRTDRAPLQDEYVAPTIRDGEGLFDYAGRVAESYRHKKASQRIGWT